MIYSCLDPEGAVPLGGAAGPLVLAGVEVHQPLVLPPEALAHLHTHARSRGDIAYLSQNRLSDISGHLVVNLAGDHSIAVLQRRSGARQLPPLLETGGRLAEAGHEAGEDAKAAHVTRPRPSTSTSTSTSTSLPHSRLTQLYWALLRRAAPADSWAGRGDQDSSVPICSTQ